MDRLLFFKQKKNDTLDNLNELGAQKENKVHSIFKNHPDAVFQVNIDGTITYVNDTALRLFGYSKEELNHDWKNLYIKNDQYKHNEYLKLAFEGVSQNFQTTIHHKNGKELHVDITYIPIVRGEMKVESLYIIMKDMTDYFRSNQEIKKLKNNLEWTQSVANIGNYEYDIKKQNMYFSKQMYELLGIQVPTEFVPNRENIMKLIHPNDQVLCEKQYQEALKNKKGYTIQYRIIRDDSYIYVKEIANVILDEENKLKRIVGTVRDVTKQNKYEKKIKYLTYHDPLTDIPNRTFFEQKVKNLIEQSNEFSMLYIDLDRFRKINESLGQEVGDKLLRRFGLKIIQLLNENSLIARIGGDKFGIIVWGYETNDYPVKVAENIIDSLDEPFIVDEYEVFVTSCIGICSYPSAGKTLEDLIRNTDSALDRAKNIGKNHYFVYSPSINITTLKQYHFESDLCKSIQNKELVVQFQPRVDPLSGRMVSAEALVRWEHPVWGMVSPAEFIPLAEETGFINDIGDWVMKEVCHTLRKWKEEILEIVPISINISAQRFLKRDWKKFMLDVLDEAEIDPSMIELEITETTLIKHEEVVEEAFQFLKGLGVKIALDDFGTGYSSLSYIKNLSTDTIKIDKSFTDQISKDENVEVIVKSLIFMAKGMEINVVAEGVETPEQLNFLKQLECNEVQGYIYSKPVPKEKFVSLLKRVVLKPIIQGMRKEIIDKRKYFRIDLTFPLGAYMSLVSINNQKVKVGKTEVLIENIGPGGLRFLSTIHLPIRPDAVYVFETTILGQKLTLYGEVLWKEEVRNLFQYGLQFKIEENDRDRLIKLLNDFSLQLRNNPLVPDCDFVRESKFTYLKKQIELNN